MSRGSRAWLNLKGKSIAGQWAIRGEQVFFLPLIHECNAGTCTFQIENRERRWGNITALVNDSDYAHREQPMSLDELCINTIRFLSIDGVQKANSGHPGLPMGCAPAAYILWTRHLKYNPKDPQWPDRDRFVLSAGHGSMLLYSVLHLSGYALSMDEIKRFRQWGSLTPGHPERDRVHVTPGVEITTGPLGQGFANRVGMALAERFLRAHFGAEVQDHRAFAIVSDGDMMESIA